MKKTKYSNFCLQLFGKVFENWKKDQLEEKNILLVKADIHLSYEEFYALAIMNTLIGFICSLIFTLVVYIIVPSDITLALIFVIPILVMITLGCAYLYYPAYKINKRAASIDMFLPYAINFISSMAVAGISPAEIFQTLSAIGVYGEVQTEAKRIAKDISIMGTDNISALKHAIDITPSKKFKSFIQGIIGTIQSGSDLHIYLGNVAKKYMEDDLVERKKDLELLSVIAEVFVISTIAFPIFLVIILIVMGFFGSSMSVSLDILLVFSFLILPFIYAGFYFMIESTSAEKISKVQREKYYTLKQFYEYNKESLFIFSLSAVIMAIFFGLIVLLGYLGEVDLDLYLYLDVLFLTVLFLIGPISFYSYLRFKKKKEIQKRLPDFLIEVGDSLSTGMTIFEAIKVAEKGHYGGLSPEIKKMKSQLSWDISVKNVLHDFAVRMKSAIIQRIVITIDKGLIMGGDTPKIFKAAAGEVEQVNQIENQRKTNMSVYMLVVMMCFFIFLAIILILDKTIFAEFIKLQTIQIGRVKGLTISPVDPMMLKYSMYSFIFVQSIGAGALAGFMMDGRLSSGIRFSCILGIVSFFIFKFLF